MKNILIIGVFILGVVLALYLGIWVMFIGGIAQIINSVKDTPVNALGIAIGIARFMFAWLAGWATFALSFGIATALDK